MRAEEDENSIGGLPFLCRFEHKRGAGYMWIIWTIIIGLLAGIVAKLLMPGRDKIGFIMTSLLAVGVVALATRPESARLPSLLLWIYPPLVYAAVRFGPLGAATSLFCIAALSTWATAEQLGPFVLDNKDSTLPGCR